MTSPAELFVVELARASRKANRLVRGLPKQDREDILANALAWCWEHRESYSLTTSLDTWFVNAVRDAYKKWHRGEEGAGVEILAEIPTGDTTLASVEAMDSATKLVAALPKEYKRVAMLDMMGYTKPEMVAKGIPERTVSDARSRIKQLRKLVPDAHEYDRVIRTPSAGDSDDDQRPKSTIDKEIEQLEAMPKHGADCPPCWKCKWFEGYLPGPHRRVGMAIQEPEVAKAVADTEARKHHIGLRVRAFPIRGV